MNSMKSFISSYLLLLLVTGQQTTSASRSLLTRRRTEELVPAQDLRFPEPQPNDVIGTVNGCAEAFDKYDADGDGSIRRDEYLPFVNEIGDLLCYEPFPEMTLQISTTFLSISCLCVERELFGPGCCDGDSAQIYTEGAADPTDRTADEDTYLRAACLLTEALWGPSACQETDPFFDGSGIGDIQPRDGEEDDDGPSEWLWLLLLLLLLCCCCIVCCCCGRRRRQGEEEWEKTVTEEVYITEVGQGPPLNDRSSVGVGPGAGDEGPKPGDIETADKSTQFPLPGGIGGPRSLPIPPPGAGDGDDGKKKKKAGLGDEDDPDKNRKFRGEGGLPGDKDRDGINLRPIPPKEKPEGGYPPREYDIVEPEKIKREDSTQKFDPYIPDGGVHDPQRPGKDPVEFNPQWEREIKKPPSPVDLRKRRKQMGLGDGEVWDALTSFEEEEQKKGRLEKIDWVVEATLEIFSGADDQDELTKESEEEENDEEGETEE